MDPLAIALWIVAGTALAQALLAVWNAAAWPSVALRAPIVAGSVSLLIPARDEERNLPDSLAAAIGQDPTVGEILVYDDHSSDGTAAVVHDFAARDARVRLVEPQPLPAGWCGKNFACATLAGQASLPWLLFVDADAHLRPDSARRLLQDAIACDRTLVSAWPRVIALGLGERLLMPFLDIVVFTLFPGPLSLKRDDPALGLAHGACILVRADAYARVGGHGAVRGEIFEDSRLARLWRMRGERGICLGAGDVVSVRMYRSMREVWHGFQKNFFPAFQRRISFWAFLLLHGLLPVLPVVLFPIAPLPATIAAAALLVMRAALALRFGHAWWSALLHPVGSLFLLALGLSSWWRCRSGRGVEWKGRTIVPAGGAAR